MRVFFAIITTLLLYGCASSGNVIEQNKVDLITIGKTTKNEMVVIFGAPLSQSFGPEGKLSMMWYYVYVGPFGTGMKQQNLAVLFGENGRVEKYNLIDSGGNAVRLGR